jgi:hypothetical protein
VTDGYTPGHAAQAFVEDASWRLEEILRVDIGEHSGSTATATAEVVAVLELLKPKASKTPLIRIGGDMDGAYLVPDDLDGIVACFSPGVSRTKYFEDFLAERYGIQSHMCDFSCDVDELKTPLKPGMQTFVKKWLDVSPADWPDRRWCDRLDLRAFAPLSPTGGPCIRRSPSLPTSAALRLSLVARRHLVQDDPPCATDRWRSPTGLLLSSTATRRRISGRRTIRNRPAGGGAQ